MIEKQTTLDRIEVLRDGHVQIRYVDLFVEDGIEVTGDYYRRVLSPGDDTANEDERVKKVAQAVWTPEVVTKYKAKIAEQELAILEPITK